MMTLDPEAHRPVVEDYSLYSLLVPNHQNEDDDDDDMDELVVGSVNVVVVVVVAGWARL